MNNSKLKTMSFVDAMKNITILHEEHYLKTTERVCIAIFKGGNYM